ncbi:hypothetical protein [Symbioplanes lichenis]|uniref:hypothetical protein n=1 Tax=Symbioplanes lichenis TaxID=1629072 RepID=UPI00273A5823|nr:hypothetical protein [Actinoplanes lichenis]
MDSLDRLLPLTDALLRRVDAMLEWGGAPAGHEVWHQIRRVRLLPGDAVQTVAALRPAELHEAARRLRRESHAYAGIAASLPGPGPWSGPAADAYDRTRQRLAKHISGTDRSLDERLAASATLAERLAEWMSTTRSATAAALVEILTSIESVRLSGEEPDPHSLPDTMAAAEAATVVLRAVADAYDAGQDLLFETSKLKQPLTL